MKLLHGRVVGVLVRHVERAFEAAPVGVLPLSVEDGSVQVNVVAIDGPVEGDGDHLRDLGGVDIARHSGAVWRAEAVGQLTLTEVTVRSAVGVLIYRAGVFVGAVTAVGRLVTEELLVDAVAVAALQLAVGADGLIGLQVGQDLARLCRKSDNMRISVVKSRQGGKKAQN